MNDICPVCGNRKNLKWDLCKSCQDRYGFRKNWAGWLRYLVSDKEKEDYQEVLWKKVITFHNDEYGSRLVPFVPCSPLKTRPAKDMVLVGRDLLPYAPYDNAEDNKRYRRAQGIKEGMSLRDIE